MCTYESYCLAQPANIVSNLLLRVIVLGDDEAKLRLKKAFRKVQSCVPKYMPGTVEKAACKIAAKRLINKALQIHKINIGALLACIRCI